MSRGSIQAIGQTKALDMHFAPLALMLAFVPESLVMGFSLEGVLCSPKNM